MLWYWWMTLGALALTALRAAALKARETVAPVKTCGWCRRVSGGFEVTGHSYDECGGPKAEQRAAERREADRQFQDERRKQRAAAKAATDAENITRLAARMRILQVGVIATRQTPNGNAIDVSGWHFDTRPGPNNGGPSTPQSRAVTWQGAPEQAHGWTLLELHTIAHGGACQCDVLRLAPYVRY